MRRRWGRTRDDRASGTVVSFIVGTALFLISSTVLVHFVVNQPGSAAAPLGSADTNSKAQDALDLILGTPGYPLNWQDSPDTLTRFGLLSAHSTARIDPAKFDLMAKGRLYDPSSTNGYVDYDEARAALGLAGYDFHLRAQPVFGLNASSPLGLDGMSSYHVAYVGHFPSGVESAQSQAERAALAALGVSFTNVQRPAVVGAGDVFADDQATLKGILDPLLGSETTSTVIPFAAATDATFHIVNASDISAYVPGASSKALALSTVAGDGSIQLGYTASKDVRAVLGIADLTSAPVATLTWNEFVSTHPRGTAQAADPNDYGWIEVSTDGGVTWTPLTDGAPSQDTWTGAGVEPTSYTQRQVVISSANCASCPGASAVEVALHWHADSTAPSGAGWFVDDVSLAPTSLTGFDKTFDEAPYDLVIVGSDVTQSNLALPMVEDAFRDYVNHLGGRVLALGGASAPTTAWLQPLFQEGVRDASPPLDSPDVTHPILTQPNKLEWDAYPDSGQQWGVAASDLPLFDVITKGPDSGLNDLLVSRPYAFYQEGENGALVLTTYTPWNMSGDQAKEFFANVLAYGKFHDLYADVGPAVPSLSSDVVSAASRTATMDRTLSDEGVFTEIGFTVYVWPGNTQGTQTATSVVSSAPKGVHASSADGTVYLFWSDPGPQASSVPAITGFDVYHGTDPMDLTYATQVDAQSYDWHESITNGTTMFYNVTAVNAAGQSTSSNVASATPGNVPMVPTSFSVLGGVGQDSLSWSRPWSDNGAHVAGYHIYRNATGSGTLVSLATIGGNTSFVDANGKAGVTYTYAVAAMNAFGEGPMTSSAYGQTLAIPNAPTSVQAVGGVSSITVTWTPPSGTVNYYDVYAGNSANPTTLATNGDHLTSPTYTETGLGPGTTRHYRVEAVNDAGTSALSNDAAGTTIALPGQAGTPTLTLPARGQVNVSWSAVSNGGGTISAYKVYGGGSVVTESLLASVGGSTLYYVDSGLGDGATRWYHVVAVNEAGAGPQGPDNTTTTYAVPAAPNLTATSGLGQVQLTWVETSTDVSNYTVYEGSSWPPTTVLATGVTGTSYADTGIANGNTRSYQIVAINPAGSTYSKGANQSAVILPGPPAAPTVTPAAAGQLNVSWSTISGASGLTQWSVNESSDCVTYTNVATVSASTLYYLRTGLPDNATRCYKISANAGSVGATGDSPPGFGTTYGMPATPASVTATGAVGSITVTWTQSYGSYPANVANWSVYGGNSASPTTRLAYVTSPTYTDSGLGNGVTRYYRIVANNPAYSTGYSSPDASTSTIGLPGAVVASAADSGKGGINVSWTTSTNGGGTITGYTVYRNQTFPSVGYDNVTFVTSATYYNDSTLKDGVTYTYNVTASNQAGAGPASNLATATTYSTPSAPTNVVATPGAGQIQVAWTASTGATSYNVYGDASTTPTTFLQTVYTNSYTETGLGQGVTHYYRVTATNPAGTSAYSSTSNAATSYTVPGTMSAPTLTLSGRGAINVSWTAPTTGGGTISSYKVYEGSTLTGSRTVIATVSSSLLYYNDTGLSDGDKRYYNVTAVNEVGESALSGTSTATTYKTPADVAQPTVTTGVGQLTVSWANDSTTTITSFSVYAGASANPTTLAATVYTTSWTETGLSAGQTRHYTVKANNPAGSSPDYSPDASGTTVSVPGTLNAPTVSISGRGGLNVTWTTGSNGGGTVTGYTVYRNVSGDPTTFTNLTFVTGQSTTYDVDSGLKDGVTYYYKVAASNELGPGSQSLAGSHATATTPTLPTILTAVDAGKTRVWVNITAGASDLTITNYTIYKCGPSATPPPAGCNLVAFSQTGGNNVTYVDLNVTHGSPLANTYWYEVSEWNAVGESAKSVLASASV
jgi:hypothetical protein